MEQLELQSADGTRLRGGRWAPEGEVKGDVLLVHGLAEHLGRYEHVAATLNAAGYRVTGVELRGHGHSEGKRGFVASWEQYVDDVRAAANEIDGPHAVMAHSMGGLVSLDHLRDGMAWAAYISAPLLGVAVEAPRWKTAAAGILTRLLPRLSMDNEIDTKWICSDPAVVEAYDADPLVFGTITPRWYTEALAAMERVAASAKSYDMPMLAMWGTMDKLVSIPAIEAFCADYGGEVSTRAWEGLYHEIHNEKAQGDVLAEVVKWFDGHLAASGAAA